MIDSTLSSPDEIPQGQLVYRRLLDEIAEGLLLPGARLREVELAERLGHSRTPVREAIRLLEADGLVVHLPRLGATIRSLDYTEVMELYEMRAVLEGTAARLAARMAGAAELAELARINALFHAAADDTTARALNHAFHALLLEASRNRFVQRAMRGLQKTLLLLGPSTLQDSARSQIAAQEHDAVLAALQAADGAAAEAAMRHHMEGAHAARLQVLHRLSRGLHD
ncbi:GntR family transcriptional regulator [Falsigemmobacter intermedius]|uniref:GntR family transcriptional regulator n=1 Tax=Falsigemmobacter intermedius TaxID=1553448 RepID=A0A3S3UD45_9RHOB|nr:GntR family transcriptional regulator [Falsigemmobacter intermedius]RWY41608.1 GntR family transcriptional regulator [Falsigemmobacter intermedius]